ncbi:hypothetical protein LPUS_07162 [Lasallia pustulata]|uniref:Shelterin complex subunit TPP1/Est3 domain-containing protein n=1 Tax=Lasallia pustulata TaxID=136370 RepID=A0A1W5D2J3_9LECA|nr:hypothetical protein LPUS_07162 [Lasallia pustulata]
MDVLRPWIGLAVQCELDAAVQWRKNTVDNAQSEAVGEVTYEDDGSNLRVASHRVGVVQIREFQTYEEPIQAVVSDSQTSIQVIFAASSVSKYTAVARKRITDGTRGGLVQIRAFEIVATHLGPKQSRLKLLIKDFQSLGCDGSGTFGNPLPIGSKQNISAALNQLGELRAQAYTRRQPQSDSHDDPSASDIRSQAADGASDNDGTDVVTQAAFATQSKRAKYKGGLELGRPPEGKNDTITTITNSPPGKPSVSLSRPGIASDSNRKALLDLLKSKNKPGRFPMSNVIADPSFNQGLSRASAQGIEDSIKASEKNNSALAPSLAHSEASGQTIVTDRFMATRLAETKALKSPGSVKGSFYRNFETAYPAALISQSLVVDSGSTMHQSSTDLSIERPNRAVIDSFDILPTGLDTSPLKTNGTSNDDEEHPWKGMRRISRRDVIISRDQQALLDRQNSWLPPEPGHRGPVANVPIAVLQSLNTLAEHRATQAGRAKGNRQPSESPDGRRVIESTQNSISSDEESEEEQESDVPVSSSEWPPSSPPPVLKRNELPPDSSPASGKLPAMNGMEESKAKPGGGLLVTFRRGSSLSPHDEPAQYQTSGNSPQPGRFPEEQGLKHDESDIVSITGPLHNTIEQLSIQTTTGSNPQQGSWAHQLDTAARVQTVSRDVTRSKRSAQAGLAAENIIEVLSDADQMSDSDNSLLETSVPLALGDQPTEVDAVSGSRTGSVHAYPSTVSQGSKPVIQVKRTPKRSATFDEEVLVNQQIQSEVDAQSLRSASVSSSKYEPVFPDSGVIQPLPAMQALGQSAIQLMPSKSPVKSGSDTKRKADDHGILSPNITKRRKRFKPLSAFNFSQDQQEIQDPSVLARQQRREFFASRKGLVLQSNADFSNEAHEDKAQEAKHLITGLPEVSKDAEDVVMSPDHQLVEMNLSSELSQNHDTTFEPKMKALEALEERRPLLSQPIILEPTLKVPRTAVIEGVEDHAVKASETGAAGASTASSIHDRFRATYSEYTGDLKHFIAMAKKIDTLRSEDRMEHRSLWDDFIVRHKIEYRQYLLDCTEKAEDPIAYERFYRNEIDEPKFTKEVVTPSILADVLALAGPTSHTWQPRRSGAERYPVSTSSNQAPAGHRPTSSRDEGTIDTTADSQEHRTRVEPEIPTPVRSAKKGPRPLLWAKPAVKSELSPPVRRKATPGSPVSSRSLPLPVPLQTSLKPPMAAAGSPLRPRSARSDVSPAVAERKEQVKAGHSSTVVKNGHLRTAQQERSSVTDRLDTTSNNRVVEEGTPPSTADWWTDVNAPFKSFVRAYVSIESGKGNSFAKAGVQGHQKLGRIDSEGLVRPREKELDVLSWKV